MKSPESFDYHEEKVDLWRLREQVDSDLGKPYPVEAKIAIWRYKGLFRKNAV